MPDTSETSPIHLDATGLLCPMPILRARRSLDSMATGQMLIITASDPASVQDMPAFCKMSGHTLHMARVLDDKYIFEIEKGQGNPELASNVIPIRQAQR
ncbi:MAG: sulfurtransferase TusA family protein [Kordiimonadaceae bacterium]|nr:sulfurtransferase TusA family protein [Kordiimonadaceae bacterium]